MEATTIPLWWSTFVPNRLQENHNANTKKANWKLFNVFSAIYNIGNCLTCDEQATLLTETLHNTAKQSIPKSSGNVFQKRILWWTDDCSRANVERKRALQRYQHSGLMADKISYKRARAIAQYLKSETRKKLWKECVSTINITTPISKIWARIGKMSGKYKPHTTPCLTRGNNLMTDPLQVENMLATHFESVSSGTNYSPNLLQAEAGAKSHQLDFSTDNAQPYNSSIIMKEVVGTLNQYRRTAAGEDGISYQMLLHTVCTILLTSSCWTFLF